MSRDRRAVVLVAAERGSVGPEQVLVARAALGRSALITGEAAP